MREQTLPLTLLLVLTGSAGALAQDEPIRSSLELSETQFTAVGCECFETDGRASLSPGIARGDVLIMIDLTGSMAGERQALIANILEMTERLAARIPDLRMGVASYRDYDALVQGCNYSTTYAQAGDWVYRLHQPLTADLSDVHAAVQALPEADGGGDSPEAYSRAFSEASTDPAVGWLPGRRNVIVNFGDELPHDCGVSSCLGYTGFHSTGADPGPDRIPFTVDDLRILDVMDALRDRRIALLHVDSSFAFFPLPSGHQYVELWDCWARRTGGEAVKINEDGTVPDHVNLAELVEELLQNQEQRCPVVEVAAEPGFEDWIVEGELSESDVLLPAERMLPFRICVPAGTPAGVHRFEVQLRCGGETLAAVPVQVEVLEACPGDCDDVTPPELSAGSLEACYPDEDSALAAALEATVAVDEEEELSWDVEIEGRCPASIVVRAHDACLNTASVEYSVLIDADPPAFSGIPEDAVVDCDEVPDPVTPAVADDCDASPSLSFTERRIDGDCPQSYELLREWRAVDACGNAAAATRRLTVRDVEAPVIEGVPPNARVACDAVPEPVSPTATDACDPEPALVFTETRIDGACADSYDLHRLWEAADACGNLESALRILEVRDELPPVLQGVPSDVTVECDSVPPPASPTATDACDPSPVIDFLETRIDGRCPGEYTLHRDWTATDRCGNASSRRQVLTVVDTTPPVIEASGADAHCLWPPNHALAPFDKSDFAPLLSDNCSEPITWRFAGCESNQPENELGDGNTVADCQVSADGTSLLARAERTGTRKEARTYTVMATATDACGNTSEPVAIGSIWVPHDQREHPADCRRGELRD